MGKFVVWLQLSLIISGFGQVATVVDDNFAIAGYLPDYRLRAYLDHQRTAQERMISKGSNLPVTDLMLFSLQPDSRGLFGCCLQEDHYELVGEFVKGTIDAPFLPSPSPSTRVWVTIGGGDRTQHLPEICANSKLRRRLIGSVMNLSKKHSFIGGIDLDFFQPRTIQERDNYILFLTEAIPRWHQEGLKVSMTLRPHHGKMIPASVYQMLDRIHFMTYDMIGDTTHSDSSDNYHASLKKVRRAVEELLQTGKNLKNTPEKVLLGIPAYARHLRNPSQVKTFGEIYDSIQSARSDSNSKRTEEILDDDEIIKMHSWKAYEWESSARIQEKVNLARDMGIGGVFFWEVGQDKFTRDHPRGVLLETASEAAFTEPSPLSMDEL